MAELYIGLMSGTSVDGIDAGLVDFSPKKPKLIAFEYLPFSSTLKNKIEALTSITTLSLQDYGKLDCELGYLSSQVVNSLLDKADVHHSNIIAIGSHGQTLYHAPNSSFPFSLQIGDPNIIAEKTKITTVADFRRRDMAAKGQGAPLAPSFHQAVFRSSHQKNCIVNIGGIANITILSEQNLTAFDTGTGNTLMDYWCQKNLNQAYDKNGDWAKSGQVIPALLKNFKQADYFKLPPPKSTGKEYFSSEWLEQHLTEFSAFPAQDIQATLCQLTADSITDAIQQYAGSIDTLLVCGGGVHNLHLFTLLATQDYQVHSTAKQGVNPDYVEAMAFAWLAKQTMNHLAGNLVEVTGANSPVILGGIYLGKPK